MQDMRRELSECVLEYIIFADAGHEPLKALIMLSERRSEDELTKKIRGAVNRIRNGDPFQSAVMDITKGVYEPEVDSFLRIITRAYIIGDMNCQDGLRLLLERIIQNDTADIREKAEKASTKLSFPISMVFIAIVIIAIYPALMQFKL